MVFSSQAFLFLFLPLALFIGLSTFQTRFSSAAILILSLIFFSWGAGFYVLLLIASIALNFFGGLLIYNRRQKGLLVAVITLNLCLIAYFKYCYFLLEIIDFGGSEFLRESTANIVLPIGISFYTFQGISYVVDVWRQEIKAERNPLVFGAYLSFFPQLIAGPIVRYRDVAQDFLRPALSMEMFAAGVTRFMVGLSKKVLIADTVAKIADAAFAMPAPDLSFADAWLGALAYAMQIYFDFSGYSDMAIGIGLMFGIQFKENFDHPYAASTLTGFWRRWHISLSTWFRDYLYIPLGGNRKGGRRTLVNLTLVFLATGLWHGAAWTFVLWGMWHGAFLVVERAWLGARAATFQSGLCRLVYFLPAVIFGWVLFRATSASHFASYSLAMLRPFESVRWLLSAPIAIVLTPVTLAVFLGAITSACIQNRFVPTGLLLSETAMSQRFLILRTVYVGVMAALCGMTLMAQNFSPFLYFRF